MATLPCSKIAVTVSTVLCLLAFSGWSVYAAAWTSGGPTDSYVRSLGVSSTNPDVIYAGTASGLFKTTNGGEAWTYLEGAPSSIGVLALAPQNASIIWAGDGGSWTFNFFLHKSIDDGQTWEDVSLFKCSSGCDTGSYGEILFKYGETTSLLVAAGGVLARTTNDGLNWQQLGGMTPAFAADPNNPNTIYRGNYVTVWRTDNVWGEWHHSNITPTTGMGYVRDIAIDLNSRVYVASSNGLWSWDGASWIKFAGLPTEDIKALSIDNATTPGTVYAGTGGYGIYSSEDGGITWSPLNEGLGNLDITTLAISAVEPKKLYAGTANSGVWSIPIDEDNDIDGDGLDDSVDNCPATPNPDQSDVDGDDIGDACDMSDTDGDGIADNSDTFPTDPAASVDSDGDGYPDAWNEGMSANDSTTGLELDAFPLNADEVADTDGDGIGDNADLDDDNDGQSDARELSCGADPKDPVSFCSAGLPWLMLLLEDD